MGENDRNSTGLGKGKRTKRVAYYPLVEFESSEGEMIKVEIRQSSNISKYQKGDKISIMYPKGNPHEASINSTLWVYWVPLSFIIFGIICWLLPEEIWHRFKS